MNRLPSDEPDSDNAELQDLLERLSLDTPVLPVDSSRPPPYQRRQPFVPSTSLFSLLPLYEYSAPPQHGYTTLWSEAGAATQGVPGAHVRVVTPGRPRHGRGGKHYVVFCGLSCGVYDSWTVTKPLIHGVSGALHRSYPTRELAQAAFDYATARSWTRIIDPANIRQAPAIPTLPQPVFTVNIASSVFVQPNPLNSTESIQDNKWYIVYKGVCPGVYRS
ncbi:hypothetical protein C8J57DRAFT_1529615 [Mycena rebaudengoi]|nr:hypothetical protein C8J57DRAFT_1529615 [Mycena rebaudengoi]